MQEPICIEPGVKKLSRLLAKWRGGADFPTMAPVEGWDNFRWRPAVRATTVFFAGWDPADPTAMVACFAAENYYARTGPEVYQTLDVPAGAIGRKLVSVFGSLQDTPFVNQTVLLRIVRFARLDMRWHVGVDPGVHAVVGPGHLASGWAAIPAANLGLPVVALEELALQENPLACLIDKRFGTAGWSLPGESYGELVANPDVAASAPRRLLAAVVDQLLVWLHRKVATAQAARLRAWLAGTHRRGTSIVRWLPRDVLELVAAQAVPLPQGRAVDLLALDDHGLFSLDPARRACALAKVLARLQ